MSPPTTHPRSNLDLPTLFQQLKPLHHRTFGFHGLPLLLQRSAETVKAHTTRTPCPTESRRVLAKKTLVLCAHVWYGRHGRNVGSGRRILTRAAAQAATCGFLSLAKLSRPVLVEGREPIQQLLDPEMRRRPSHFFPAELAEPALQGLPLSFGRQGNLGIVREETVPLARQLCKPALQLRDHIDAAHGSSLHERPPESISVCSKDTLVPEYNPAMPHDLARLPAIHRLLAHPMLAQARRERTTAQLREAARKAVAEARASVSSGAAVTGQDALAERTLEILEHRTFPAYPEVINATGVLIHTNLGRAPRLTATAASYLALEYDLAAGHRGERLAPVAERLTRYFQAEAATVVTNCAAALVLLLAARAWGREVLVSRGELIEIGGSFRLPEIMAAAGAHLVEVGCTNRTRATDYAAAIRPETAAILVVHRSNFHLSGFVSTPELAALVELGRHHGIPVWVDQGSGCHLDLSVYGLHREPMVQDILSTGAEAVLCSGDKLLGGPQAGLILGREDAIAPLRRHPLRRALRPDRTVLCSLASVLDCYLAERAEDVPLYRLLGTSEESLKRRARRLATSARLCGHRAEARPTRSVLGGGTTPDQTLPSWGVWLPGGDDLARRLRCGNPPVVGRIEEDHVVLDLRAVWPAQDAELARAILAATSSN